MYKNCKTKIKTKEGIGVEIEKLREFKQSNPLSPLLFNLCMELLLEAVEDNTEGIKINEKNMVPILAFANDIVLLGKNKREAQKQLSMVQDYLKSLGMSISGDECLTFQVFSKKDTWYIRDPGIDAESKRIPNVGPEEVFRYLGAKMGPWKGLRCGIIVSEILNAIKSTKKLSLKPGQMELLLNHIFPRYIYNLLINPSSERVLKLLDNEDKRSKVSLT